MLNNSSGNHAANTTGGGDNTITIDWNSIPNELWIEIFLFHCSSFRSVLIDIPSISKRFYNLTLPPKLNHLTIGFHGCSTTTRNNVKQTEMSNESINTNTTATEGDLLYGRLLEFQQESTDFDYLIRKHGSLRSAFIQSVNNGIKLEKCFWRELIYHASRIFSTEQEYRSYLLGEETTANESSKTSSCNCHCGSTILMTEDFSTSCAGLNLIATPMMYDSGVKFYEFRVHKSGEYDNFLMGVCLTEVVDLTCPLKTEYSHTDSLSSRFLLEDKKTYDLKYDDYLGSQNSIGWAYYNECKSVFFNGLNYGCSGASFSSTLSYSVDESSATTGYEYVFGIYFDTRNMKLVFAKNGSFSSIGFDLSHYLQNRHPKFTTRQVALYPCLSMGHKNDAVTFKSRIPFTTMDQIRKLVKQVDFQQFSDLGK